MIPRPAHIPRRAWLEQQRVSALDLIALVEAVADFSEQHPIATAGALGDYAVRWIEERFDSVRPT